MSAKCMILAVLAFLYCSSALGANDGNLHMLVFSSDACPHCKAQKPFIDELDRAHDRLDVLSFDVRRSAENRRLFQAIAIAHGVDADSIPAVFVGGRAWIGDSELVRRQIIAQISRCLERGDCPDSRAMHQSSETAITGPQPAVLDLPLLGPVDLMLQPVVISTVLIAFVDGFNPCSLWVLTILLALVIHSGSRKRVMLVGTTFLLVTATIYGLFITGVFGSLAFLLVNSWIYWVVALFALVFALVNIKDYFWFQRGISFTIDDKHKPGIYRRIRGLLEDGRSVAALVGATALMAAGIAFIELPCTAGFPVIWGGIVASQDIGWGYFAVLLALYLLIYLAIELVIFIVALVSLRVDRFEERHGRILKLIGGVIMLTLALVLVFAPELMHDLRGAIGVFVFAAGATIVLLVLHRQVLPKFGIHLGDEWR
jgi:cytochrome c biogenesis protein CcdA/glutaredoxin